MILPWPIKTKRNGIECRSSETAVSHVTCDFGVPVDLFMQKARWT